MAQPELTYPALAQQLLLDELPLAEPSPELWPRIAAARHLAVRRRRLRRGLIGAAALAFAGLLSSAAWQSRSHDIDWQARAQALELELHALTPARGTADLAAMQVEIANLDRALQTAYDEGNDETQRVLLWKKRSELLDALLEARRHQLPVSRT